MKRNILLHIPHNSTRIPMKARKLFLDLEKGLEFYINTMTDLYTKQLFSNCSCYSHVATLSRLYCDVERFRNDNSETMSKRGMGAVYTHLFDGTPLIKYDSVYREEVLTQYYDPYHKNFEDKVDKIINKFGSCLIIDCHSFSDVVIGDNNPDICIGFDEDFKPFKIVNQIKEFFASKGYIVDINKPYVGSIVPNKHYKSKSPHVKSVMIEINKKLYLDSHNNIKKSFYRLQKEIGELLNTIACSSL